MAQYFPWRLLPYVQAVRMQSNLPITKLMRAFWYTLSRELIFVPAFDRSLLLQQSLSLRSYAL